MNDQWQDKLRNRVNSHEEPAPKGLWEGLEKRMVSENLIAEYDIIAPGSKKRRLWKISLGVATASAAVFLLFFLLNIQKEKQATSQFTENNILEFKESIKSPAETPKETPVSELITSGNNLKTSYYQRFKSEVFKEDNKTEDVASKPINKEFSDDNQIISKDKTPNERVSKEDIPNDLDFDKRNDHLFASSTETSKLKRSRWQTNVSMSNSASGSVETYSGYGTFALEETVDQQYAFISQYTREEAYTDVKHEQPLTIGLTLRYNINNKWNLSSGLTYSLLSSKLRSESNNYFYDDTQTLHYLGIPLNVGYTFWQKNKFSTYISAGGLLEKNIAGKLISNYYIDNELESTTSKSFTSSKLQWSVNSAIGIEYRISKLIGIYAEPGIVYYFNNGSNLESIYKDQPTNFNLRIGLRFNIND